MPVPSRFSAPAALVASVALHVVLIAASSRWARALAPDAPLRLVTVDLTELEGAVPHAGALPPVAAGAMQGRHPEIPESRTPSGPIRPAVPDTRTAGRGGTRDASQEALRLSDSVDGITLDTDPTLLSRTSQLSRKATADERRSREDRRTVPDPMELTFVASGSGVRLSRLAPAPTDPGHGTLGAVPVPDGARQGDPETSPDAWRSLPIGSVVAGASPVVAAGVDQGRHPGEYRRSAAVAISRPQVRPGRAATATTERGLPADTVDANEEVASAVQALITASTAGGRDGRGPGGSTGGGDPGAGGLLGAGTRSLASGDGGFDDSAAALGIQGYAASVTRKVYPFWEQALPTWALAEGRGGVAVIGVTIGQGGAIRDVHVVRASGIPEFDRNVSRALELAQPYGPLPRAARGELTLHIAFDAMNPVVGRNGPGPGHRYGDGAPSASRREHQ